MATVASVYSTPRYQRKAEDIMGKKLSSSQRPKISNKRVWASVETDAKSVIESVFEEASRRDAQQKRDWVVVIDGEQHQLKTIKKMAKKYNEDMTIILDFIHVLA